MTQINEPNTTPTQPPETPIRDEQGGKPFLATAVLVAGSVIPVPTDSAQEAVRIEGKTAERTAPDSAPRLEPNGTIVIDAPKPSTGKIPDAHPNEGMKPAVPDRLTPLVSTRQPDPVITDLPPQQLAEALPPPTAGNEAEGKKPILVFEYDDLEKSLSPETLEYFAENVVYLPQAGCSGYLIRNEASGIIGVRTAEHCLLDYHTLPRKTDENGRQYVELIVNNFAYTGDRLDMLTRVPLELSTLIASAEGDGRHDLATLVVAGVTPEEALQEVDKLHMTEQELRALPIGSPVAISGFPVDQDLGQDGFIDRQVQVGRSLGIVEKVPVAGEEWDLFFVALPEDPEYHTGCLPGNSGGPAVLVNPDGSLGKHIGVMSSYLNLDENPELRELLLNAGIDVGAAMYLCGVAYNPGKPVAFDIKPVEFPPTDIGEPSEPELPEEEPEVPPEEPLEQQAEVDPPKTNAAPNDDSDTAAAEAKSEKRSKHDPTTRRQQRRARREESRRVRAEQLAANEQATSDNVVIDLGAVATDSPDTRVIIEPVKPHNETKPGQEYGTPQPTQPTAATPESPAEAA